MNLLRTVRGRARSAALITLSLVASMLLRSESLAFGPGDPGSDPLVDEPCGVLPPGGLCFQGTFTDPYDAQELVVREGQTSMQFRGVAERDTPVYVFFIKGNGELVNELAYETTAGHDGIFTTEEIPLSYMLDEGETEQSYRGAAYFRTSVAEHPNGQTFYQITGNPIVHFTITIPPPPEPEPRCGDGEVDAGEQCDDGNTESGDNCSASCTNETLCGNGTEDPGEQCDPPNGRTCSITCQDITCNDGTLDRPDEVCDGTDFGGKTCTTETGGTKPNGTLTCRNDCTTISTTQCTGTGGGTCGGAGQCGPVLDMDNTLPTDAGNILAFQSGTYHQIYLLQPSATSSTAVVEQTRTAVRARIVGEIRAAACLVNPSPSEQDIDDVITACRRTSSNDQNKPFAISTTRSSLNARPCTATELLGQYAESYGICAPGGPKDIAILLADTGAPLERCIWNSVCYTKTPLTGVSPLLFLTSHAPVETTVRVVPRGGVVTVADPAQTDGAWRTTAGPVASPLYYEFSDGVLRQLELRDEEGWTVDTSDAAVFLQELLLTWGYDPYEVESFLARDVRGKLPPSGTLELRVVDPAIVARVLPLVVTPQPARVERLLFHVHAVATPRVLRAPDVDPLLHAGASGLTVREFGAVIVAE